jgi:hypothetical protein
VERKEGATCWHSDVFIECDTFVWQEEVAKEGASVENGKKKNKECNKILINITLH